MGTLLAGATAALWFGILTSISPCPLATNVAAVSWLSRDLDRGRRVLLSGVLYALGRSVVYVALGALIVTGLERAPGISTFLRTWVNQILGPVLIVVGLVLLGWFAPVGRGSRLGEVLQARADRWGLLGSLLVGAAFALSFCPVSAGLFFGSLLTLAVEHHSPILLPTLYGIGTALPALVFAIAVAAGAKALGTLFRRVTTFATWAGRVTGAVFVGAGLYLTLVYVYG